MKKKPKKKLDRELLLNSVTGLYLEHWRKMCWSDPESVSQFIVYNLMTDFNALSDTQLLKEYKNMTGKESFNVTN